MSPQGQYLPMGVDQAWPFLVSETLKAEHRINAQPGAALTVRLSGFCVLLFKQTFKKYKGHSFLWKRTRRVI